MKSVRTLLFLLLLAVPAAVIAARGVATASIVVAPVTLADVIGSPPALSRSISVSRDGNLERITVAFH